MKAKIIRADFNKEFTNKFGTFYSHRIEYDDKVAYYNSKKIDQTYFKAEQECEFIEEEKISEKGKFLTVKPPQKGKFSNYHKDIKREQSKYSGFAMSYAKDLVIADKIPFDQMLPACKKMFNYMVELDSQDEKKKES